MASPKAAMPSSRAYEEALEDARAWAPKRLEAVFAPTVPAAKMKAMLIEEAVHRAMEEGASTIRASSRAERESEATRAQHLARDAEIQQQIAKNRGFEREYYADTATQDAFKRQELQLYHEQIASEVGHIVTRAVGSKITDEEELTEVLEMVNNTAANHNGDASEIVNDEAAGTVSLATQSARASMLSTVTHRFAMLYKSSDGDNDDQRVTMSLAQKTTTEPPKSSEAVSVTRQPTSIIDENVDGDIESKAAPTETALNVERVPATVNAKTEVHEGRASPPHSIANDSPHHLLLLHQEAAYRKLLLQELDMNFVTIAERGWFERDVIRVVLQEEHTRINDLIVARSRDLAEMAKTMVVHQFLTAQLIERKAVEGSEMINRRTAEGDASCAFASIVSEAERDHFWLIAQEEREAKKASGVDLFGGIELPPDALNESPKILSYAEQLTADAKKALQPAPPAQSRLAAYKQQRRYRQDVDYRKAVDVEKERANQSELTRAATLTGTPSGAAFKKDGVIDRMILNFSAPDNFFAASAAVESSEAAERQQIINSRAMWFTQVISYHRRYRALTVDQYRQTVSALNNEETIHRGKIVNEYFFMLMEFFEALETLHRRDLIQREIPIATAVVASSERRGWLSSRRREMARKDVEHAEGEAVDAMMRRRYFEWDFAMLQDRTKLGKREAEARVNNVYNRERQSFQIITEISNLEFPVALRKHLKAEALRRRLSTVVEWTPATYANVYLAEADQRNNISRTQKEVWERIVGDEAKEYLTCRREEVLNAEMHKMMAAYDARVGTIGSNTATSSTSPALLYSHSASTRNLMFSNKGSASGGSPLGSPLSTGSGIQFGAALPGSGFNLRSGSDVPLRPSPPTAPQGQ